MQQGTGAREHKILRFYIVCLEAEQMRELELSPEGEGRQFVLIGSGQERLLTGSEASVEITDQEAAKWLRRRALGGAAEQVFAGYPVVCGTRRGSTDGPTGSASGSASLRGEARAVISPLFYLPVEVKVSPYGEVLVKPESPLPELNVYALELLGLSREERIGLVRELEELEEVQEARTSADLLAVWIRLLKAEGLVPEKFDLAPESLAPLPSHPRSAYSGPAISNTEVIYAGERGPVIRNLVQDLEELCLRPADELRKGPLGVLFGTVSPGRPPAPEPQPCVLPTNLAQDRAITSAISAPFTVVTGPPGTGKSQVLVNTVAAALARGERVLFASKNNQAVDVVFERLAGVSAKAVPIRAGAARFRGEIARAIHSALARPKGTPEVGTALAEWRNLQVRLDGIYETAGRRELAEVRYQAEEARYGELLAAAPRHILALVEQAGYINPSQIAQVATAVIPLITEALRPKPFWPWSRKRWRQRRARLEELWGWLRSAVAKALWLPEEPDAAAARGCYQVAMQAQAVLSQREQVQAAWAYLHQLPDTWALNDQLASLNEERSRIGRRLFDACWEKLLSQASPNVRHAASSFADGLARLSRGEGGRVSRLLELVPDVLEAFPVWGLTNLSARTNLPLRAGIFDLVVIDEASQCDIPSAIPLLYRAKRALIIGDPKQLIHVTSLPERAEDRIASRCSLGADDCRTFSFVARSLFSLASSRVGEAPLFLDQHFRSHPSIITFSNDHFYGSRLHVMTDSDDSLGPAVSWVHVRGRFERGPGGRSVVNRPEAEVVVDHLKKLAEAGVGVGRGGPSLGVVTPYRAQAEAIRELVVDRGLQLADDLVVATAHRFQGDERDVIVFSPTVSAQMPAYHVSFASDPNLVNVAITRARRKLLVVGDREACLESPGVLRDLAQYVADLEAGGFRSPLERRLYEALWGAGLQVDVGLVVDGYRLDLAVVHGNRMVDVECDGAAFHRDERAQAIRDQRLREAGWKVLRFSGRDIQRDLQGCVRRVLEALG